MRQPGQIGLLEFPHADLTRGKRRPVLLLAQAPGHQGDWWVCMLSTQSSQAIPDFDEVVRPGDSDFDASGLRSESVIRIARVAVVEASTLIGAIGNIAPHRLARVRRKLADWLNSTA
jgi:mRNA interferase MazF